MTNSLHNDSEKLSSFGTRLRERRKLLHLSQEALGVAIGLDESCGRARISRYESDTHQPNIKIAKLMAKALQVPLEYLYCDRDSVANFILVLDEHSDEKINKWLSKLKGRFM